MKYRIIKKWRRDEDHTPIHYYIVEKLSTNSRFFRSSVEEWQVVGDYHHFHTLNTIVDPYEFKTLIDAKTYVRNISKPLPADEIIDVE